MPHGNTTHGHAYSATYRSWNGMMTRCYNQKREKFARYGGRGIVVCERWRKFENFLADMGKRPKGKSLDRVNNDGNYKPENCRWATPIQQRLNSSQLRLYSYNGDTKCLRHWCKEFEVKYETAIQRLKQGRSFIQAMAPVSPRKTHCLMGHPYSGSNLYVAPNGRRTCIACRRLVDAKRRPAGSRCGAIWTRKARA